MKNYKLRPILRGFLGYIPGLLDAIKNRKEHTGTIKAEYCYSVWLRHYFYLREVGFKNFQSIAEIGPGASIGIGLAAILAGTKDYYAFDLIEHTEIEYNLAILDDLQHLYEAKSYLAADDKYPKLKPKLPDYSFPSMYLAENFIDENLHISRIQKIRDAIRQMYIKNFTDQINICYLAPWYEIQTYIKTDLILSQAVLEHIDEIEFAVDKMVELLKREGVMSHVIDYTAHETHNIWNGHWSYPDNLWKIISNGRSYPLNRKPHSYYLDLFKRKGLEIVFMQLTKQSGGITYKDIPYKNRHNFEESDFEIAGCYFILKISIN